MSIAITDGATMVTLPPDLQWIDEFGWSQVEQETAFSITGKQIVDQALKVKGRPITLKSNGGVWVPRSDVETLQAFYNEADTVFTLTIGSTDYSFQFSRPGGFQAVEVRRLARMSQGPEHKFTIEIKGFEVAA